MQEDIFYEDFNVRITSLRLNFKSETIPIDTIDKIDVRMKVTNLVIAFIGFLISLSAMFLGKLGIIIIVFAFIWLAYMYSNYIELWIVTRSKKVIKISHASIANSKYIYKIADALKAAMDNCQAKIDEGSFDYTETMKFTQRVKEFEE